MKTIILPQKVATGTAYACLRPIEIPFERRSRSLSESTGASDVPLCIPFAEESGQIIKKQRMSPAYSRKHPPPINSLTNDVFGTYSLPIPTK